MNGLIFLVIWYNSFQLDSDPVACEVTTQTTSETFKLNTEISRTFRVGPYSDPVACEVTTQTTSEKFQLNNVKLYVLVVTLSINDKIKFLKNVKQGFKWTISWDQYWSQIITETNNNNLDHL